MANDYYLNSLDDDMTSVFMTDREDVHRKEKSELDLLYEEMEAEDEADRPEATAGRIAGGAWQEFKHSPVHFAASARSYLENELSRTTDPVSKKNFEEAISKVTEFEESEAFQMAPEFEGSSSGYLEDVARGISGSALDMGLTIVTPPIGMAAMFSHIQGASYKNMEEKIGAAFPEMTSEEVKKRALTASTVNAAVQTPLELIGNLFKIKGVLGKVGFTKRLAGLAESAFGEGITEYVQQFPEEFAVIWAMNPDLTRQEFFAYVKEQREGIMERATYAGAVGAGAGAGTTTIGQIPGGGVELINYISPKQRKINAERKAKLDAKIEAGEKITEEDVAPAVEEEAVAPEIEEEAAPAMTEAEVEVEEALAREAARIKEEESDVLTDKITELKEEEDVQKVRATKFTKEAGSMSEALTDMLDTFEEETGTKILAEVQTVEEFAATMDAYLSKVENDAEFQNSGTTQEQEVDNLADNFDIAREELRNRLPEDAHNRNQIKSYQNVISDIFALVQEKGAALIELGDAASNIDLVEFSEAMEKFHIFSKQLVEVGSVAGGSLQAFDNIDGKDYGTVMKQLMGKLEESELTRNLGKKGIVKLATVVSAMKSANQLSRLNRKARRIGFGDMFLEGWISGLLSNPTTHAVNITTNSLVTLFAVPERYMGEISSNIRRKLFPGNKSDFADTKDPGQMEIEEGEALALGYGLVQGLKDAMQLMVVGLEKNVDPAGLLGTLSQEGSMRLDAIEGEINTLNKARSEKVKESVKSKKTGEVKAREKARNELKALKESEGWDALSTKEKEGKRKEIRDKRDIHIERLKQSTIKIKEQHQNQIEELEKEQLALQKSEGIIGEEDTKLERMRRKAISAKGLRDVTDSIKESLGVGGKRYSLSEKPANFLEQVMNYIGSIIRIPSGALLFSDKVFRQAIGYRMNLYALAHRTAMSENLQGMEQSKRMEQIVKDPEKWAPQLIEEAKAEASYQVFVNKLGEVGQAAESTIGKSKLLKIVMPFFRTPVNIFKFGMERTPLAIASKNVRADIRAGGARADMAIAKMATGSMIAAVFSTLAMTGFITGSGPPDKDMRNLKRNQGWQPNSFFFNDTYYSYSRTEPFGMLIGMTADAVDIMGEASLEEADELAALLGYAFSNNVTSKTWLRGVSEITQALNNPERYSERYVYNLISTIIPSGVGQLRKSGLDLLGVEADPVLRDIRIRDRNNEIAVEMFYKALDTIKAKIPGYSKDLNPRVNIWGEDITLGGGLGPDMISPIYTNKTKVSAADEEMYRLGVEDDRHFSMPRSTVTIQGVDIELTSNEYYEYVNLMNRTNILEKGRTLKETINSAVKQFDTYDYPDEVRFNIISNYISAARRIAKNDLYKYFEDVHNYVERGKQERIEKLEGK